MIAEADAVVARVRKRAIALAALGIVAASVIHWQAGVSLTIGAAVVIFSFLVLERLTERLLPRQQRKPSRTLIPLLLVTGASVALLSAVLWKWREFDPIAGAIGLSVVVLSVMGEALRRRGD